MKDLSQSYRNMLDSDTRTFALCIKLVRSDGEEFAYTNHDLPLTFCGTTYNVRPSLLPSPLTFEEDRSVGTFQVSGSYHESEITKIDVKAGRFDKAAAYVYSVNYKNLPASLTNSDKKTGSPTCTISSGVLTISVAQTDPTNWTAGDRIKYDSSTKYCWISSVINSTSCNVVDRSGANNISDESEAVGIDAITSGYNFMLVRAIVGNSNAGDNGFKLEFHTMTQYLKNKTGITVTAYCTARFCDYKRGERAIAANRKCKLDPDAYLFSGAVASVSTSRKVFTATITSPNGAGTTCISDNYFTNGEIEWLTGNNSGLFDDILEHDYSGGSHSLTLARSSALNIEVGDTFQALAGCSKIDTECQTKWAANNMSNFRGFNFLPGPDRLAQTPNY